MILPVLLEGVFTHVLAIVLVTPPHAVGRRPANDCRYDSTKPFCRRGAGHYAEKVGKVKRMNMSGKARILVRRPPSEVFNAFADAGSMSKFWFTRRDDGLKEGETVTWFLGSGDRATAFDVRVEQLRRPDTLTISWERDSAVTRVEWTFEATQNGDTILTIEESGFAGSDDAIVNQALDSTGGFNQVIVAAKAWIEHGVALSVVADHA